MERKLHIFHPGDYFDQESCLPTGVFHTEIHRDIQDFMFNWTMEEVLDNYSRRHPAVNRKALHDLLQKKPQFVLHAGIDFIFATKRETGQKGFILLETNTTSGGVDCMPPNFHAYETHLTSSFFCQDKWKMAETEGSLAFLYGGTKLDTPCYPHFMAEISNENVYSLPFTPEGNGNGLIKESVKFENGVMYVRDDLGDPPQWRPIRACFRRFGDKPWLNFPISTNMKTFLYPYPICCVAGGKNKILAHFAYQEFNAKNKDLGLEIQVPRTVAGVERKHVNEVVIRDFGSRAIIKAPYDALGRGHLLVQQEKDIGNFLESDALDYNLFLVQELIGVGSDNVMETGDKFRHVGYTGPDGSKYACTFRLVVTDSANGFKLIGIRAARAPTASNMKDDEGRVLDSSFITNIYGPVNFSGAKTSIPMDAAGVEGTGIRLDDVVDGYVQCVMAILAIDQMCQNLIKDDGSLNVELLTQYCPDPHLLAEINEGLKENPSMTNGFH